MNTEDTPVLSLRKFQGCLKLCQERGTKARCIFISHPHAPSHTHTLSPPFLAHGWLPLGPLRKRQSDLFSLKDRVLLGLAQSKARCAGSPASSWSRGQQHLEVSRLPAGSPGEGSLQGGPLCRQHPACSSFLVPEAALPSSSVRSEFSRPLHAPGEGLVNSLPTPVR